MESRTLLLKISKKKKVEATWGITLKRKDYRKLEL